MRVFTAELSKQFHASTEATAYLKSLSEEQKFQGIISSADAKTLCEMTGWTADKVASWLVGYAQMYATPPISDYKVGAVGIGLSGAMYYGANLEIVKQALSFSVHAEQSSIANAWNHGEEGLSSLAISAAPCGYCRQFLYELKCAAKLQIALPDKEAKPLTYYLPDAFGPGDLGVKGGLMQAEDHKLQIQGRPTDTGKAALAAASASYSPYTKTYAGVALRTESGKICVGRYAENAAYNPSMSPLEAALSQLTLYNERYDAIVEAVLVQADGKISQLGVTKMVLEMISRTPLTVLQAFPPKQ